MTNYNYMPEDNAIIIDAKQWRDNCGNTYHIVKVVRTLVEDGKVKLVEDISDITYGYGSHFKHTAMELVGLNKSYINYLCRERPEAIIIRDVHVKRKMDLCF